jgi:hypothetical protein
MKRNIVSGTLGSILLATLSLALSPAANAQQSGGCSTAGAAGQWGYAYTGTIFLPSGAAQLAAVGRYSQDQAGHAIGRQTRSVGGVTAEEVVKGTIAVQPDCTATAVIRVYAGGKLQRTGYLNIVYVNGMKQSRWIFEALVLPDKTNVPVVITADMNRL